MFNSHLTPILFLFLLSLISCSTGVEKQLEGQWNAFFLTENSDTLDLPPNDVQLIFSADKTYRYNGTLRYREAGTYRVQGRMLYTTDTLNNQAEKAVHIERLKSDTLILNMVENKQPRRLKLQRFGTTQEQ